jgi:DNA polymerase-1
MPELALYFEEAKFRPLVQQFFYNLLRQFYDNGMNDEQWDEFMKTEVVVWHPKLPRSTRVLAFGHKHEHTEELQGWNYVTTISQGQIMTKASPMTEVRAALELLYHPPVYAPMEYTVVSLLSPAQERALGQHIVIDIETSSNGKDYDSLNPEEKPLLSIGINDGKNIYVFCEESLQTAETIEQIIRILKSGRKLIAHNMKFDFRSLGALLGINVYGHLDTMILLHTLFPGLGEFKLKESCRHFLGAPEWEKDQKKYLKKGNPDFAQIPRDVLYKYNAYDVYWTWHLLQYLSKLVDERTTKLALHEFKMVNLFQDIEMNGAAVDLEYIEVLHEFFSSKKAESLAELQKITRSDTFNPNSPKQVKEALLSAGIKVESTAEKVLEELRPQVTGTVQSFIDNLLDVRGFVKMDGTYAYGLKKHIRNGNMVYPTFHVQGTNTGRLSSSKPNIQNQPRDPDDDNTEMMSIRRTFIPRAEDRVLVSVDYSQAELRVMACLSEDEYLISLFQPGMPDFFDSLMPVAYPNVDFDKIDKGTKKNLRAKLKAVIYGLSYGRQAFAIGQELKMPTRDAQRIITNYFNAAPEFYEWRQTVTAKVLDLQGDLITPFGRTFQSELITGRNRQNVINSGLAFLPQSTASDLCVVAAMEVHDHLTTMYQDDAVIIATIHDAILMDVRADIAQEVADFTQGRMIASGDYVFNGVVPFATEATMGESWKGI